MTIILAVACVSLGIAAVMSGLAWRLAREEERRSDARVSELSEQLGTVPAPARHPAVRWSALAMAGVAVASITLLAVVVADRPMPSAADESPAPVIDPPSVPAAEPAAPLELESLGQTREGRRLVVRGKIKNPSGSLATTHLTAIVSAFNDRGDLVATGRASAEPALVSPGADATFVVSVPRADGVSRYRVSFRDDDRVLSHVDRRRANE